MAEIWPEFAAHGKDAVTIGHVLSHSAGVPGVPPDTTIEDLCDWHKMCTVIADAELWWEPGTKVGYHAVTFGYLVGEVVRRATGNRSRKCSGPRSPSRSECPASCTSACRRPNMGGWPGSKTHPAARR